MKLTQLLSINILMCSIANGITNANAAEFHSAGVNMPGCDKNRGESHCFALSMTGQIEAGDATKFLKQIEALESIKSKNLAQARVGLLFLESPGGDVAEAMKLGRLIRQKQISTHVVMGDTCASACVLTFAGGVRKVLAGNIVIHSFYSPNLLGTNNFEKAEKLYTKVSNDIATFLKDVRVSSLLLEEMMRIPHFTSRKLELEELTKLGLLGIDPVYAQTSASPVSNSVAPNNK